MLKVDHDQSFASVFFVVVGGGNSTSPSSSSSSASSSSVLRLVALDVGGRLSAWQWHAGDYCWHTLASNESVRPSSAPLHVVGARLCDSARVASMSSSSSPSSSSSSLNRGGSWLLWLEQESDDTADGGDSDVKLSLYSRRAFATTAVAGAASALRAADESIDDALDNMGQLGNVGGSNKSTNNSASTCARACVCVCLCGLICLSIT